MEIIIENPFLYENKSVEELLFLLDLGDDIPLKVLADACKREGRKLNIECIMEEENEIN